MGFYDNNPGAKNAFATAGAIHDGVDQGSAAAASDAADPGGTSAVPTEAQKMSFMAKEGFSDPSSLTFNDPSTDPMMAAAKAGVPAGTMQMMAMRNDGTMAFDAGGAMPDTDGDNDQAQPDNDQDDQSNPIDALFAHGRQKMGLMQMAGAIPNAPGTQSPNQPQPAPGPLPPTATPFGKRPTPPTPGRLSEVVPMNNGLKGAAGQYKNWGRDKTKPDDNSNVIPMQPVKTSDAGAIPEEEEAA